MKRLFECLLTDADVLGLVDFLVKVVQGSKKIVDYYVPFVIDCSLANTGTMIF